MWTDPLVLSVLQTNRVVGHTQQRDDEVDQSKDAVEPQKVVPERHKHTKKLLLWLQQLHWVWFLRFWAISRHLTSLVKCETHSALTLASVVLPKFSGLSPVGKNATWQASSFRLKRHSCCLQDEAMVEQLSRDFPDCSAKLESRVSEISH